MGKNRKKFIDKKASATYVLLHRESGDGNDEGGSRVLTRVDDNDEIEVPGLPGIVELNERPELNERTKEELLEMGFPDDGYNYMMHLRSIGTGGGQGFFVPAVRCEVATLPEDVKAYDASRASPSGILHVAAKGLDSDVAAALEVTGSSSEESGDELEDDFVMVANKDVPGECSSPVMVSDEEDVEDTATVPRTTDERPTRFLDKQFDALVLNEYDEEDSELEDDPRAKGPADISELSYVLDEFLETSATVYETPAVATVQEPTATHQNRVESPLGTSNLVNAESEEEVEDVYIDSDGDEREKWDCETIISTLCNTENHPATIGAPPGRVRFSEIVEPAANPAGQTIRIGGKQKLPLDFVPSKASSPARKEVRSATTVRARGVETPEERKARKATVKEEKRASRQAKKELKLKFKGEAHRAQAEAAVCGPKTLHLP